MADALSVANTEGLKTTTSMRQLLRNQRWCRALTMLCVSFGVKSYVVSSLQTNNLKEWQALMVRKLVYAQYGIDL